MNNATTSNTVSVNVTPEVVALLASLGIIAPQAEALAAPAIVTAPAKEIAVEPRSLDCSTTRKDGQPCQGIPVTGHSECVAHLPRKGKAPKVVAPKVVAKEAKAEPKAGSLDAIQAQLQALLAQVMGTAPVAPVDAVAPATVPSAGTLSLLRKRNGTITRRSAYVVAEAVGVEQRSLVGKGVEEIDALLATKGVTATWANAA